MSVNGLTTRQKKLVRGIAEKNLTPAESARLAGYSESTINSSLYVSILRRESIIKELDKYGLNNKYIFKRLRKNTRVSKDQVVSVSDSNKAIELALKLKGYLNTDREDNSNSNNNTYIKELKVLNINELQDRISTITSELDSLK
jgi:hypothetical protein